MRKESRKIGRDAALRRAARVPTGERAVVVRAQRLAVTIVLLLFTAIVLASDASAEPLDLSDARPRWIEVRFEVSPADEPGSLDRQWSAPRRARLEPLAQTGRIAIHIPATELEDQLRSTGSDPIGGSFSDFVWTLDPVTGHVRSAGFSGRVREEIRLGPFRTAANVDIQVEMNTEVGAGYVPEQGVLGIRTNRFCAPGERRRHRAPCVAVEPVRFDPASGYVNAVGHLRAAHPLAEIMAFSPLGEVEFLERPDGGTESAFSGSSHGEALCSRTVDRSCPVDGGDT